MSSTGTTTSMSSGLRHAGVDDRHRTGAAWARPSPSSRPPRKRAISSSGRWVADRPMRWGGAVADCSQPLERERQVRAALGGGERVDLVDDHRLDAAQRLARRRGEHQVERLGRGDEDVGRVADQLAAVVGRGVAGAHADGRLAERLAQPLGRQRGCPRAAPAGSSRRRRPAPAAARRRRARAGRWSPRPSAGRPRARSDQAVDAPQEGGQRLARPGGGQDQRVVAGRDGRPPLRLRGRGRGEGRREPRPHGRREPGEDHDPHGIDGV